MRETTYKDFSLRVHEKALRGEKRVPVNATLELTYRCTNRCVHCYCNLPAGDPAARQSELAFDEIEKIFDALRDMGCLWILLTGGDPLLRKDFSDIYLSAKRHGFIVSVFTNGVLIDDRIADLFAKYPPFVVEITMYGATRQTYETVTRSPGSYDNYWAGLKRLLDRNVKVKLKAMALTITQHEIGELDRIARDLGRDFRFDPRIQKRIDRRTDSDPTKYRISPQDVVGLDRAFPERMEAQKEFCDRMIGAPPESDRLLLCGAGKSSLHIMPDGTVLPCSMMLDSGADLRTTPLPEIWDRHIPLVLERKRTRRLECHGCTLINLCGQCPGWAQVEYGTPEKKVEYLCRIAKTRAASLPFL